MEPASIFYRNSASAQQVTPAQGPQPAQGAPGPAAGMGVSNLGLDHVPVFTVVLLIGLAFVVVHLLD